MTNHYIHKLWNSIFVFYTYLYRYKSGGLTERYIFSSFLSSQLSQHPTFLFPALILSTTLRFFFHYVSPTKRSFQGVCWFHCVRPSVCPWSNQCPPIFCLIMIGSISIFVCRCILLRRCVILLNFLDRPIFKVPRGHRSGGLLGTAGRSNCIQF